MQPSETYRSRLETLRGDLAKQQRSSERFAWLRLGIGIGGAAVFWLAVVSRLLDWPWLLAPVLVFLVAARAHDRVVRRQSRLRRAIEYHERALHRLGGDWAGKGNPGAEFLDPSHPYAADLDLFGPGSVFELLCAARTRGGARVLADWLARPADLEAIRARQLAVQELRGRLDLREDLAVLGEDLAGEIDSDGLARWGEADPILGEARFALVAGAGLAAANWITLAFWLLFTGSPVAFCASAVASVTFAWVYRSRVRAVLRSVDRPSREMRLLADLLERLEGESFRSLRLVELHAALARAGEAPASGWIARLARLTEWNDSRQNQIFAPVAGLFLLGTGLAFAIERWRAQWGREVRRVTDALAEVEALASLAGHAYEHPDDPFPDIVAGGPRFDAEALGHPLLPEESCVRNDVRLGSDLALLLVSGSNMSGKSTLLRSVGVNVVLAQAGAPVRALSLAISPVQVGACMRVQDSLQKGTSHFYAEILRLRSLVELAGAERPLLFLLDEILHGTNSHDRRIGADGLIRGLLERGAIGLVTTHDLALARIAEDLAPRAANVHFEDQLEGDRIEFDYRLRAGVVKRSNALALMRAVGLRIPG